MHCPNCGKQNADQTKYCRACGNDLEIVSQAVKGRLPILIATKIDQILDSRSERFRRDSLVSLVTSLTVLSGGFVGWLKGYPGIFSDPRFFLLATLFLALLSLLEYVAYRRTLSPDFCWTRLDQDDAFTSLSDTSPGLSSPKASSVEAPSVSFFSEMSRSSVTESTTSQLNSSVPHAKERLQTIYCPGCGKANAQDAHRCSVCGANIEVIAEALEPPQESWLTAKLDSFIRRRDKKLEKMSQMFVLTLVLSCIWLWQGIQMISNREPGWWYAVLFGVIFLVTGVWDRITYRRNSTKSEPRPTKPFGAVSTVPTIEAHRNDLLDRVEFVSAHTEGELMEPSSATESTTRRLENDPDRRTDPLRKHDVASDED